MLQNFYKPARHPDIQATYEVPKDVYISSTGEISKEKDISWSPARLDVTGEACIYPQSQFMPSWTASNSIWTDENNPEKIIAFLPVLPYPVTDHSTVYTAMKNFMDIRCQLQQNEIPMYCDEGVYCIVRGIQLMRPKEFQTLVPCLGTFHMVKAALRCIGKYLEGSGAGLTWLEAGVFGPSVIETSVLKGGHYSRCLEGMRLLAEAFSCLMYKEFFTERGIAPYAPQLDILKNLKAATMEKNTEDSKMYIAKFSETSKAMVEDINNFIKTRSSSNENFNY